ncbi:hypothetical protein BBJ28_00007466 [Nothophytophthora sp. Chile5]|nr:hypothetical protein BBJ28_00007466 [Nothophytophthora sp. Chile5]
MASHGIQVSCRVRQGDDSDGGGWSCVNVDPSARRLVVHSSVNDECSSDDGDVSTRSIASYSSFDGVYPGHSTQQEVFDAIGRPFVADLLAGYNCTILAYGQTGSGKTYTTVGGRTPDSRGLVPRAMESILEEMAQIDLLEYDVSLAASFVEVYQERLRDLLLPHSSRPLLLREDKEHSVRIEGASEIAISTVASGVAVLARGNTQRATGSTLMNADSSRSHSVLTLTFVKKHLASSTKIKGRMVIVDLAGSEKTQKTAATGIRMEEAKYINRVRSYCFYSSLSALGNVINALTDEKAKHIPYRDSKLTRLLQASLGGNAKTHLLLTCSASSRHMEETLSTLRFGCRAKYIQNSPHVNNETSGATAEYAELLTTLQDKIENLHRYVRQLEASRCQACRSQQPSQELHCTDEDGGQTAALPVPDSAARTSEEDPATDWVEAEEAEHADLHNDSAIVDALMREEMQSMRKALADMMRDLHAQEREHHVAQAVTKVAEQQLDTRHRSQQQTIQQQEAELHDALATIASLEAKLELLDENARGLRAELQRSSEKQLEQQQGENAEAEILRRQLDAAEKHVKSLQRKLAASRQEQDGEETHARGFTLVPSNSAERSLTCVDLSSVFSVALKIRLTHKEQEVGSLRDEMETLRSKKPPLLVSSLSSPSRAPQTRPVTAVEFKCLLRDSTSGSGASTGVLNIQSWWAGGARDPPNQNESSALLEPRGSEHLLPTALSPKSLASGSDRGSVTVGREELAPLPGTSAATMARSASSSAVSTARPLRARLVGLLNSLEEETSAYRELVVETKERAMSRGGGRQRHQLPCLDGLVPAADIAAALTPPLQGADQAQYIFNR